LTIAAACGITVNVAGTNLLESGPMFPTLTTLRQAAAGPLGALVAAAVAAGLCGVFLNPQAFGLLAAVSAVVVVGLIWPAVGAWGLRAELSFDADRGAEGRPVRVRLRVANRLPVPAYGMTLRGGGLSPAGWAVDAVPAGGTADFEWDWTPDRRGVFPGGNLRLTSGFPFGLWEAACRVGCDSPLVVWPRAVAAPPVPAAAGEPGPEADAVTDRPGEGGELLGVRDYRRGDSPRRIHWGRTARCERLIVCEYQAAVRRPDVRLLLDLDPAVHTAGPDGSREWAIRIAAGLASDWLSAGVRLEASLGGAVVPPDAGERARRRLMDRLAALPADGVPAGPTEAPEIEPRSPRLQVLLTTDRRLMRPDGRPPAAPGLRIVLLETPGFGGAPAADGASHPSVWLRVSSPQQADAGFGGSGPARSVVPAVPSSGAPRGLRPCRTESPAASAC
jgi:uncharacterized protein (DUF58 family)